MEDFTQSFHASSSSSCGIASLPASSSSSASFDDSIENSCSICLEPFSIEDPASITNCKHEYHLHCILEWSQRSLECPICCRLLVLSDPSSQELLDPVEAARHSRTRIVASSTITNDSPEHDSSDSHDPGRHDEIMQHLTVMSGDRNVHGREGQRSGTIAPQILVLNSSAEASGMSGIQPVHSPLQLGSIYPVPMAPSGVNIQHLPLGTRMVKSTTFAGFDQRVIHSEPPAETPGRLNTSEAFAVPESIKSKFAAASARYKESISKSTRGLREKLLAHNSSVKELSKGVQREMTASIAGLARMIERIELSSKRTAAASPANSLNGGSSSTSFKGKNLQDNVHVQSHSKDSMVFVPHLSSSAATSHCSSMVACPMEVRPAHLEGGH